MAEHLTPISKARAALTRLSRAAQKRLDRYVITQQGQPQSVLLGYDEYRGMQAAVELLQRPQVIGNINAGLKELESGKRLTPDEMKKQVREKMREGEARKLAAELADKSGVDLKTVEAVLSGFETKVKASFSMDGRFHVPGVGDVVLIEAVEYRSQDRKVRGALRTRAIEKRVLAKVGEKYLVLEPATTMEQVMVKETKKAI
jgi:PHD/YefM family antitoxin component YafN of YafNO toxin-antitoxin module